MISTRRRNSVLARVALNSNEPVRELRERQRRNAKPQHTVSDFAAYEFGRCRASFTCALFESLR
jgi:hypothetical protein